jgi:hypothetical protein
MGWANIFNEYERDDEVENTIADLSHQTLRIRGRINYFELKLVSIPVLT